MPSIDRCIPSSEAKLREKEAIKRAKQRFKIYNEDFKNHCTDVWEKMVKKKKEKKLESDDKRVWKVPGDKLNEEILSCDEHRRCSYLMALK